MYLIVGLGNPEPEYSHTRHNMGFDTINKIAEMYDIKITKKKFNSLYGSGEIEGKKVVLVKPQTYMNLSGEAIGKFVSYYKINDPQNIIVIYDDMDTEISTIKIRKKGGPGSHNGMKSVVHELGTEEFSRVRIGIGKPIEKSETIDFVIKKIDEEIYAKLEEGIEKASKAIVEIIRNGIDASMNKFN